MKTKKRILFISLLIFFFLASTSFTSAELFPSSIVPCSDGTKCNLSDFVTLAGNIIKFLVAIAITGSVLVFAYAGFKYMTARGNSSEINKAHGMFGTVAVGLILVLTAWLIVSSLLKVLTGKDLDTYKSEYIEAN